MFGLLKCLPDARESIRKVLLIGLEIIDKEMPRWPSG